MRLATAIFLCLFMSMATAGELYVAIVQGLGGTPAYGDEFDAQVATLKSSAEALTGSSRVKTFVGDQAQRQQVLEYLASLSQLDADDRLAVYLIGHGSYDGIEYKFNLPGPDLTGADLSSQLDDIPAGTQLVVNTSSASGALLEELKRDSRIVITATRSGGERHATRFGGYFAAALTDAAADINKNGVITALEAFDYADRQVADWFQFDGRLATEHPKLAGDRAARFTLARLAPALPAPGNPARARLVKRRDDIDSEIENLQLERNNMPGDDYFKRLEGLLLELAAVQEQIDSLDDDGDDR